jgi:hypothetical protein
MDALRGSRGDDKIPRRLEDPRGTEGLPESDIEFASWRPAPRQPRPAFRVALGLLLARRFPSCAAHGLLRTRRLALRAGLRIAPYSDTLRPVLIRGFLRAQH